MGPFRKSSLNTFLLVSKEGLYSSGTRGHVILCRDMSSLGAGPEEDMSSCGATRHVILRHKKTRLLVAQDDKSSCGPRRHACSCHKKKTCLQELRRTVDTSFDDWGTLNKKDEKERADEQRRKYQKTKQENEERAARREALRQAHAARTPSSSVPE